MRHHKAIRHIGPNAHSTRLPLFADGPLRRRELLDLGDCGASVVSQR